MQLHKDQGTLYIQCQLQNKQDTGEMKVLWKPGLDGLDEQKVLQGVHVVQTINGLKVQLNRTRRYI